MNRFQKIVNLHSILIHIEFNKIITSTSSLFCFTTNKQTNINKHQTNQKTFLLPNKKKPQQKIYQNAPNKPHNPKNTFIKSQSDATNVNLSTKKSLCKILKNEEWKVKKKKFFFLFLFTC